MNRQDRARIEAECVVCGKRQPDDGYAEDALCFGPDGTSEPHVYESREATLARLLHHDVDA